MMKLLMIMMMMMMMMNDDDDTIDSHLNFSVPDSYVEI